MIKKIFGVLKGILTVALLCVLIVVIVQKFSNNKINIGGYYILLNIKKHWKINKLYTCTVKLNI